MKKVFISVILTAVVAVVASFFLLREDSNSSSPQHTNEEAISPDVKDKRGSLVKFEYLETFTKNQINRSNANFYSRATVPQTQYSVDRYSMSFNSTEDDGEPLIIKSQLFVPKMQEGAEAPLYVFGQGTTGLGDRCAPSREFPEVSNWGNYRAHMLSYASKGYIVVFPDYEGFNDKTRLHHYFNAELEGKVLLDSARAAFNFFKEESLPVNPEEAVFFAGYSQGGHAAFAVKDLAPQYAPELPIKGVIGYGATTNVVAMIKENPTFAPYLFYSYSDHYGEEVIDPSELLLPKLLPTLRMDTITICVGDIYKRYGYNAKQIYSQSFYNALYNDKLDDEFPILKKVLDQNNSGYLSSSIPSLILQGSTDPIVTLKSQKEFINQMCSAGNNLTYLEYPGVHHYQTRQVSFQDTLDWMQDIVNGQTPKSDCNKFVS
ncbi:hypothetical protein IH980_01060 [Patescibacteria group bacterium]|nr:hypothetical protein [Patescibacteria group bacterium]